MSVKEISRLAKLYPFYLELSSILKEYKGWRLWFETVYCPLISEQKEAARYAMSYNHNSWVHEFLMPIETVISLCEIAIEILRKSSTREDYDLWLMNEYIALVKAHSQLMTEAVSIYENLKK